MKEKLAEKDAEIVALKKEVRKQIDLIQGLELQADLIPILKSKIKELERIVEFYQKSKSSFEPYSRESPEDVIHKNEFGE